MADLSNINEMHIKTIKKLVAHQVNEKNVAELIYAINNIYLFEQELKSHNLSDDKTDDLVEYALETMHEQLVKYHLDDLKKYDE